MDATHSALPYSFRTGPGSEELLSLQGEGAQLTISTVHSVLGQRKPFVDQQALLLKAVDWHLDYNCTHDWFRNSQTRKLRIRSGSEAIVSEGSLVTSKATLPVVVVLRKQSLSAPDLFGCELNLYKGLLGSPHPNIVRVLAMKTFEDPEIRVSWVALEKLTELPEWIRTNVGHALDHQLLSQDLLHIMQGAAAGLAALHEKWNIVHGDVSPHNILVKNAEHSIGVVADLDSSRRADSPPVRHLNHYRPCQAPERCLMQCIHVQAERLVYLAMNASCPPESDELLKLENRKELISKYLTPVLPTLRACNLYTAPLVSLKRELVQIDMRKLTALLAEDATDAVPQEFPTLKKLIRECRRLSKPTSIWQLRVQKVFRKQFPYKDACDLEQILTSYPADVYAFAVTLLVALETIERRWTWEDADFRIKQALPIAFKTVSQINDLANRSPVETALIPAIHRATKTDPLDRCPLAELSAALHQAARAFEQAHADALL